MRRSHHLHYLRENWKEMMREKMVTVEKQALRFLITTKQRWKAIEAEMETEDDDKEQPSFSETKMVIGSNEFCTEEANSET
ncbi:hypothetical protein LINPERPRIM_LOCUS38939, partial [Linum perenne]